MSEQLRPNQQESISNLQRYLRQLSFDYPVIPLPPIDGIFESVTRDAVRAYQNIVGLPVTGIADLVTWNRLYEDYRRSLTNNTRPNGFDIFPRTPLNYQLTPGEQHFLVEVIQYILNELRILYDDIPENSQNGIFDPQTIQGIQAFQAKNGLPISDEVDRVTWNALAAAYRRLFDRAEP